MDEKRKVGLITCSKEPNYGACLQAFATQQIVENMGYDCEIMNYTFEDEKMHLPWKHRRISTIVACCLYYRLRKSLYLAFDLFHKNMRFSNQMFENVEEFKNAVNEYDMFMVGSDQVWNPTLGIDTNITLLNFYDKGPKRISYASSFGISDLDKSEHERYRAALEKFDRLSTREWQGRKIIKELINKEVPIVLDPTLLFKKSDWNNYESNFKISEPYLLIYDMQHTRDLINLAKQIAEKHNWKVVALSRVKLPGIKVLYGVSPADFLALFNKAEFIITDSFHGTAFSVNYEKQFLAYCGSGGSRLSSRIINLLNQLGLEERLLVNLKSVPLIKDINYLLVNNILEQKRDMSVQYLKEALGICYDKSN